MSATAARCPHCGARQERLPARPPPSAATKAEKSRPVLRDVTPDEARALLAASAASEGRREDGDEPRGIFATLILPSSRSSGLTWLAEVGLTVVAVPLLACSMLGAAFVMRDIHRAQRQGRGAAWPQAVALASGTAVLWAILLFMHWGGTATGVLVGVCWGALLARGAIRSIARHSRSW